MLFLILAQMLLWTFVLHFRPFQTLLLKMLLSNAYLFILRHFLPLSLNFLLMILNLLILGCQIFPRSFLQINPQGPILWILPFSCDLSLKNGIESCPYFRAGTFCSSSSKLGSDQIYFLRLHSSFLFFQDSINSFFSTC